MLFFEAFGYDGLKLFSLWRYATGALILGCQEVLGAQRSQTYGSYDPTFCSKAQGGRASRNYILQVPYVDLVSGPVSIEGAWPTAQVLQGQDSCSRGCRGYVSSGVI